MRGGRRPGLVTTLRVVEGRPWLWEDHVGRLRRGAQALGLPPFDPVALRGDVEAACAGLADARVRVHLPRRGAPAVEARTYRAPAAPWTLVPVRIEPDASIAGLKTDRRDAYDRAREAVGAAGEPLLVDACGRWLESAIANVFLLVGDSLLTPPARRPLLPGLARARVLAEAGRCGLRAVERDLDSRACRVADACLVTNAVFGVHPVAGIAGLRSFGPHAAIGRLRSLLAPRGPQSV